MDKDFICYGAQYYRAPTPLPEDWERDLSRMRDSGFNTIKIWAQWRANNPAEGVYEFSDLQRLLDLAERFSLKVVVNIILDVAPAWVYRKYPDSVMVTADGVRVEPRAKEYRQAGGAPGPCYHHDAANAAKRAFVEETAKRFAAHPALLLWDLWNEPELSCGLLRNADPAHMICYCGHSRRRFLGWLEKKYGSVEGVNAAWQRNYQSFDEVELPRTFNTFQDMIDWRTFFADTLVDDLRLRREAVRRYDTVHEVMVHTVPPPYFDMINACCSDYQMAKLCDCFGNSIGSQPLPAALTYSSAKGKPVINSEIHAVGGTTFFRPNINRYEDFKRHIFTPLAAGIRGFLYWQYRPERLGQESPAWGLTDLRGDSTPNLEYARRIGGILRENRSLIAAARPRPRKIAIVRDNANEIFLYCADYGGSKYNESLSGAFRLFYDANFDVDILDADQLLEEDIRGYRLIYYPLPYYQNERIAARLREWTASGGLLVCEAFYGAYLAECNLHATEVPGYGFDEVFGGREKLATTASSFHAAYGDRWAEENADAALIDIQVAGEPGYTMKTYFFYEAFEPAGAAVRGVFADGAAAVLDHRYGQGRAVLVGSMLAAGYEKTRDEGCRRFAAELAAEAGVAPNAVSEGQGLRVDILEGEKGALLVLTNNGAADCRAEVTAAIACRALRDLETGEILPAHPSGGKSRFAADVRAGDIRLLCTAED